MATVELRFSALPAHVRTARLVAAAVARRCGVDEAVLDEVRLAVGEACSRAVDLHRRSRPDRPVTVKLIDDADRFRVSVADEVPSEEATGTAALDALERAADQSGDGYAEGFPTGMGLAVITGLVDELDVRASGAGAVIRMSWPAEGHPQALA